MGKVIQIVLATLTEGKRYDELITSTDMISVAPSLIGFPFRVGEQFFKKAIIILE
jgi:hypothetical protein